MKSIKEADFFSSNIKLLRKRRGRTQEETAYSLDMKRSTLSGYENKVAQPTVKVLLHFSNYFGVAVDTLLKVDLSKLRESELDQLERGYDVFINGSKLRVLSTSVNNDNEENIEVVSEKAKAGYTSGFADPEYIKVLPTFQLPFLSKDRKYRSFEIRGDSMLPIPEGAWVTAEFLQNWNLIESGKPYVILTLDDGIVFKIVENNIKRDGSLKLHSLNKLYKPYSVEINKVREVWKFVNYINSDIPEKNPEKEDLAEEIQNLRMEIRAIQMKLDL